MCPLGRLRPQRLHLLLQVADLLLQMLHLLYPFHLPLHLLQ
jgi:hypothetical protein